MSKAHAYKTCASLILFVVAAVSQAQAVEFLKDQIDPDLCLAFALAVKGNNDQVRDAALAELAHRNIQVGQCPGIVEKAATAVALERDRKKRELQRLEDAKRPMQRQRAPDWRVIPFE